MKRKYFLVAPSSTSGRWLLKTKEEDPNVIAKLRARAVDDSESACPAFIMDGVSQDNVVFYSHETKSLFILCNPEEIESTAKIIDERLQKK